MSKRIFFASDPERQKRIGPKAVIETMLDLALIAGFLAVIGFLTTIVIRLVFSP
jgi:hypothetical protein